MAANVAENFSTAKAYAAGDLVLYGGILYRFTTSHSAGAWNAAQAAAVDSGRRTHRIQGNDQERGRGKWQ